MTDRGRRVLKQIMARKHKTASQITAGVNTQWQKAVPVKTIYHHAENIHGRAAIPKPLVTLCNTLKWRKLCYERIIWTQQQWENFIWSDESLFPLFQTNRHVYVWRTPVEAYNVDYLFTTSMEGNQWCCAIVTKHLLSWMIRLQCRFISILADYLHPIAQTLFPDKHSVYHHDNALSHTAGIVQDWYNKHDGLQHLMWSFQSPDLFFI